MIETTNETRCKNPKCGKPVHQLPGHRYREYCDNTCKQTAYRERVKEGRVETAHRSDTIVDDRQALDNQNSALYQEKLTQAGQRIEKLERQVEIQRQRLGQSYQSQHRIAELEAELARYRAIVDVSDRQAMIAQFMLTGEEIGYKALASVDVRPGPHAWYAFSQTADTEHLAAAIVAARNVYKQLADLRTTTEVAQLNALVADLRQKLRECEKRKQS